MRNNTQFIDSWKDIRVYRKKLWSETRVKLSVILIAIYSFLVITYLSFYLISTNIRFLSSVLIYNIAGFPNYLFFLYITWREWKEKKLLSGVFMIVLFFLLSLIYSVQAIHILRIFLILGMVLLYWFAPIDLVRIRLKK